MNGNTAELHKEGKMKTLAQDFDFLIDTLPAGNFDWLKIWEGECNILMSAEDENGYYEYYEKGLTSISVKRETEEDGICWMEISVCNAAALDFPLQRAISQKFGIDMNAGSWSDDGEGGQYCRYRQP